MNEKAKNLTFITLMQMVGCFFVIFGHSYPFITDVPSYAYKLQIFIYDFHMPLFVWCSGYLLVAAKQTEKYSFKEYFIRRAKHILVPYFAFSIIAVVPKILLSPLLNDELDFNALQIIRTFLVPRESVWGHFWFLPMIFILGILGYGILKLEKLIKGGYILYAVLVLTIAGYFVPNLTGWFSVNDILHYAFYFVLGMVCNKKAFELLNKAPLFIGFGSLITSVLLFVLTKNQIMVAFVISILMIIAVYAFCYKASNGFKINRNSVFAQTYQIFILSWPCQLIVEIIFERIFGLPFYAMLPLMLIAGIIGPIIILKLVIWFTEKTKIKFISLMIGR